MSFEIIEVDYLDGIDNISEFVGYLLKNKEDYFKLYKVNRELKCIIYDVTLLSEGVHAKFIVQKSKRVGNPPEQLTLLKQLLRSAEIC